jgi:hypothetical protein
MNTLTDTSGALKRPGPVSSPIFSRLELEVIRLGIRDGEQALKTAVASDLIQPVAKTSALQLSNSALEALRSWTELARMLLASGRVATTRLLFDAGYSATQIAEAQRLVAAGCGRDRNFPIQQTGE